MKCMATLKLPRWELSQPLGSMEGKEVRFGPAASAYWGSYYNGYFQWFGQRHARQFYAT